MWNKKKLSISKSWDERDELMQVKVKTQNVNPDELAKALSGYIIHEHISDDVIDYLRKSDGHDHEHEPIPERYMKTIIRRMNEAFERLRKRLGINLDKWFEMVGGQKKGIWRRTREKRIPYALSDDEIDELRRLIESHFKLAIGVNVQLPKDTQKKWQKAGIKLPKGDMERYVIDSYVSGRLHTILENNDSYETMKQLARKVPMSRQDELIVEAVTKNAAKYIVGYGRKLADLAEDMLLDRHKGLLHDVVQRYFSGELTHTAYNAEGFTPQEVESQLATGKSVHGWRELSTELKNRFKAVDVGRDWDRIAVSETRFASNLGALMTIQEEGGGDAQSTFLYYYVHPSACKYCKQLYLHEDGTPKLFPLSEILHNVQETGGMNIGRKASLIGQPGGWVPNALAHPNDQCIPQRFIAKYVNFTPKEGDLT